MALTNAEKQRRWKERNQVVLTWTAPAIAGKMMDMADQAKLREIVGYLKRHLRDPARNPEEKAIMLGTTGYSGLNGPMTKRQALEHVRKHEGVSQGYSWLIEATTADGQRWRNGVRLWSKEEAEVYVEWFVRFELEKVGYVTAEIIRADGEESNCPIVRSRKGGRPTLLFAHGECVLLGWHPVASAPARASARQ
jgi:hypothetical protein